jgi:hypothetical protein
MRLLCIDMRIRFSKIWFDFILKVHKFFCFLLIFFLENIPFIISVLLKTPFSSPLCFLACLCYPRSTLVPYGVHAPRWFPIVSMLHAIVVVHTQHCCYYVIIREKDLRKFISIWFWRYIDSFAFLFIFLLPKHSFHSTCSLKDVIFSPLRFLASLCCPRYMLVPYAFHALRCCCNPHSMLLLLHNDTRKQFTKIWFDFNFKGT